MLKNKVVLLGNSGVGKSNICSRMVLNIFTTNNTATIGAQFFTFKIYCPNINMDQTLQIWDTAGQERFRAMLPLYLREAMIIIIVIDVSGDVKEQLDYWIKYYYNNKNFYSKYHSLIIIFNKIDLLQKNFIVDTINYLELVSINNLYGFLDEKLKGLDVPHSNILKISCKDNIGLDELKLCFINNLENLINKFKNDNDYKKNISEINIAETIKLNDINFNTNHKKSFYQYIPGVNYLSSCFK